MELGKIRQRRFSVRKEFEVCEFEFLAKLKITSEQSSAIKTYSPTCAHKRQVVQGYGAHINRL
jgi:hypothetical protein